MFILDSFKTCFHFQNMLSFSKCAFIFKMCFYFQNVLSFSKCAFIFKMLGCIYFVWELFGVSFGVCWGSFGGLLEQDAAQPLNELQSHLNVVLDELAHVFAVRLVLKSENIQYNTLVRWAYGTNDSSTKRLTFQVFFFHNFCIDL
jgi:hypothetical protein